MSRSASPQRLKKPPQTPKPALTIVADYRCQLDLDGTLRALHNLRSGRLLCPIAPGSRGKLEALANAVLSGLGKRVLAQDVQRNAAFKWAYARAWLHGEQATDIFLTGAEILGPFARTRIADVIESTACRVWIICTDSRTEKRLHAVLDAERLDASDFPALWGQVEDIPTPPPLPPYPTIPAEGAFLFRAVAYWELDRDDFKHINKCWSNALRHFSTWLEACKPSEQAIYEELRNQVAASHDYNEALTRVRAAQVALGLAGWQLKVRMSRFARQAKLATAADLERGAAEKLRWYTGTARPAAAVMRLLAPTAALAEIAEVEAAAVSEDGSAFTIGSMPIPVPEIARPILRAQLAARALLPGEPPGSRLLVYKRGKKTKEPSGSTVQVWLRDATREIGVSLVGPYSDRARLDAPQWANRRGLSLHEL